MYEREEMRGREKESVGEGDKQGRQIGESRGERQRGRGGERQRESEKEGGGEQRV